MQSRAAISVIGLIVIFLLALIMTDEGRMLTQDQAGFYFDSYELADALSDSGFEFQTSADEQALMSQRKIITTTDINAQLARRVCRKLLLLNKEDPTTPIDLYLRTTGGWEADAFCVIDVMQVIEAPVNIHAIGDVESAGLMIFCAATGQRSIYENTMLGFHTVTNDEEPVSLKRYIGLFKQNTKLPASWLQRTDDEMLYFDANDAIKYQVADVIIKSRHSKRQLTDKTQVNSQKTTNGSAVDSTDKQ